MERGPIVSTNDSIHMPSPWSIKGPSHPEEEGKLINISLGYEVLPLCMGPAELCIKISWQTWAFTLPPQKDFWTLLGLFTALSLSVNHVYTTETLRKELGNPVFLLRESPWQVESMGSQRVGHGLVTKHRTWKLHRCPSTSEWMKFWYIYTMEYYSAIRGTNLSQF